MDERSLKIIVGLSVTLVTVWVVGFIVISALVCAC